MGLIHDATKAVGRALEPVRAGANKIAIRKLGAKSLATLEVTSPSFTAGGPLPKSATADGGSVMPSLHWDNVPTATQSFVVIVEDPDAPFLEPYVQWMVFHIPAVTRFLDAVVGPTRQGKNSRLRPTYTGAAPPTGHGRHHYHFQVFALDCQIELDEGAGRRALLAAMRGHVLACGDLVGTYERF